MIREKNFLNKCDKRKEKRFRYLSVARYIDYENSHDSENINHIIYIKVSHFSVLIYQTILMAVKIHIRRFAVSVAWLV